MRFQLSLLIDATPDFHCSFLHYAFITPITPDISIADYFISPLIITPTLLTPLRSFADASQRHFAARVFAMPPKHRFDAMPRHARCRVPPRLPPPRDYSRRRRRRLSSHCFRPAPAAAVDRMPPSTLF
jgi:hypothetical protein